MKFKVILITLIVWCMQSHGQNVDEMVKQHLKEDRPRLLLTDDRLEALKSIAGTDSLLHRYINDVLLKADNLIGTKSVEYQLTGPRLLSVSRDVKNRTLCLGLAYRWTGNEKYADELVNVVNDACNFPNWNPAHFLDVAEMTFAVAIAYDWLYEYLDDQTKNEMENCLIRKGLNKGLHAYENEQVDYGWWKEVSHNWNQVCNGGLMVGALALADLYPNVALKIIDHAVSYLPLALREYNPDGAWTEGPGYWNYATSYTAYAIGALQTALNNHTFGLTDYKGLAETGYFPIYTTGPTGYYLNFADSRYKKSRKPMPCMFWLASTFNNLQFSNNEHNILASYNAEPEHIIWYISPQEFSKPLPLNKFFESDVQILTMRDSWSKEASFLGIKAGFNQVNHGHLDLGNFEIDAFGERWAIDLGSDNYNLPGYWDNKPGGKRWDIFRLGSKSHNVITINEKNQHASAESHFVKYNLNGDEPHGILELTNTFPDEAQSIKRGVKLIHQDEQASIFIQDEIKLKDTASVTWRMTTEADISVDRRVAVLKQNEKTLIVRLITPEHGIFITESAEQDPPEERNTGVQQLMIYLPQTINETISVLLIPQGENGTELPEPEDLKLQKLSEW